MRKKEIITIIITIIISLCIYTYCYADEITSDTDFGISVDNSIESDLNADGGAISIIQKIGVAVATIILPILGTKYMLTSPNEKAKVKETLIPYVIGAFILYAGAWAIELMQDLVETTDPTTEGVAGVILGIVQTVGVAVATIMLAVLGIKYMLASPNEKAEIKKSATTYIIGALVLYGSSGILYVIKTLIQKGTS